MCDLVTSPGIDPAFYRILGCIQEKAAGIKRKKSKIDTLVKALMHADNPLKDLILRGALFVAMALQETEHLDNQMVHQIILRLLDTYHEILLIAL